MTRATKDRSGASTLGHDDERDDLGSSYLLEEEDMESDGVFSQRFTRKCLREIDKSKLNPTKRKFIDETSFGDLKRISPFIVPHDLMEWLAMNIDTGKRELMYLTPLACECNLRNIYHKNDRAPIAHTVDVLHKARNDDVDTTKRSWVLLAFATILTPRTGNMHQLNYSLPRARFVQHTDFDILWEYDKNKLSLGKASFGKCRINDTYSRTDRVEDINPMENEKSAEEDVCGSLDDWLQNPIPFGVELEVRLFIFFCVVVFYFLFCQIPSNHVVKLYVAELKGATNSFVQVLQAMHCRRNGQLLKDAGERGGSKQTSTSKASHERGGSKQSYSRKVADEPTIDKMGVELTEGARSNHSSNGAHEPNAGNVVEFYAEASVDANHANVEKEQVEGGEDVEHGPQLSPPDHSAKAGVGGHWSDAPLLSPFQEGTWEYNWWIVGSPKPQEEPVVLLSTREPSPNRDEEKAWLKEEEKFKSKKIVASPISAGAKYKKIKTDGKTQAMYKYFIMNRYNMNKTKKGKLSKWHIGDFHITYSNFQKSLKPHAKICNEVMSLFIESFNIEKLLSSNKEKKFSFSVLISLQLSIHPEVFDPTICGKELRRACQNFQISFFDLLFFTIVRGGHWIGCVVNLLHKQFNLFDLVDNGNLDMAARNLFTNFKRIDAEEPNFIVDLNAFKPDYHINLLFTSSFCFWLKNNFDCGYFGVLYFENFDGKRMKDFKKQNMLDVRKYLSSKLFYHPLNKVSTAHVHKSIVGP
ncbi:hypothetical protein ZWY2020_022678 [Hordeum vulgare]|nr:hypothetical protein ZWY2020_022678 [Hordeum vulgare]